MCLCTYANESETRETCLRELPELFSLKKFSSVIFILNSPMVFKRLVVNLV